MSDPIKAAQRIIAKATLPLVRPTVAELEAILNSPDAPSVNINTDGSIGVGDSDALIVARAYMEAVSTTVTTEDRVNTTQLLPCPFCGGHAGTHRDSDGYWEVFCDSLQEMCCAGVAARFPTCDGAIAAWNRRAPLDATEDAL